MLAINKHVHHRQVITYFPKWFIPIRDEINGVLKTITHASGPTGNFADASKKLGGVVDKADSAMDSAKKAADDLQKVLSSATQGKGLLAALLTNQE